MFSHCLSDLIKHIEDPYVAANHIKRFYRMAANSTTEERASRLSDVLDGVLGDYRDSVLTAALKTGKARHITPNEAKRIHPICGASNRFDPPAIYVEDPKGIRIPELYGARSLSIILNPEYEAPSHLKKLLRYWSHNTLYGWENGEPVMIEGSDRPHMSNKRKVREYMKACNWYESLNKETSNHNAETVTLNAFVDFSAGNSFPVGTFHSNLSTKGARIVGCYKDSPAQYLAQKLKLSNPNGVATKATFISDDIAVITTLAGETPKGILTCLTITTPPPHTLTGETFNIKTIEYAGDNQPVAITFQAN
jgi:hypothetical protein